jgi:RNA polymerase sigma-70 factor (ECF subfamily)
MSETTWAMLRELLVDRYDELKQRLARRLGSTEMATETLHETWLRLARTGSPGVVHSPTSYVFRVALNVAFDRRHAEGRELSAPDIEALRHLDEDELSPLRIAEARSEIMALKEALDELPARCRSVFVAARVEGVPQADIAKRLGISTRMVERELKRAFDYFEVRLEKKAVRHVGSRGPEPSSNRVQSEEDISSSADRHPGSEHHE